MFQTFLHQANYLAIIVSSIFYFILGAVWYSPLLFAKPWMQHVGRSEEQLKGGSKVVFLYTLIALFIICFVTSFIIWILGTCTVVSAIKVGLFISLGYTSTIIAINNWYGQRAGKLTLIDAGYHVIGIVAAAVILALWK
jgi:MFS family permease